MTDDTFPAFSFLAVQGNKVTAAFDGGHISSGGGVMLFAMAERRLGVAERLAHCFPVRRDPARIIHGFETRDSGPLEAYAARS